MTLTLFCQSIFLIFLCLPCDVSHSLSLILVFFVCHLPLLILCHLCGLNLVTLVVSILCCQSLSFIEQVLSGLFLIHSLSPLWAQSCVVSHSVSLTLVLSVLFPDSFSVTLVVSILCCQSFSVIDSCSVSHFFSH